MNRLLRWDRGTLILEGFEPHEVPEDARFDARIGQHRAPAICYHQVVLDLHQRKVAFEDQARAYTALEREHAVDRSPRGYQADAVDAWWQAGRRGIVVLPTGAGKSFVAELCIARAGRTALVVAPTIDLVGQWYDQLARAFGKPIGVLGGGHHELEDVTVATYDSAWMHVERWGHRYGTLVFDEIHHLPGPSYAQAALGSIAPFRLGLTATLERPDGAHQQLDQLVGPVVFRKEITDLAGDFLAPYRTEILRVHLSSDDRAAYDAAVTTWRTFVASEGLRLGGQGGWQNFLRATARSERGREAFRAWRRSRDLVQGAPAKLRLLAELLGRHHEGRVIVFTHDNATVHEISRRLLVPAITHHTDVKERRALLAAFSSGDLPVLATSRVLNEGVDVPAADVAIVLSGTATVREHVQRLGRILRPREGKQAVLYEIVVADSLDETTSRRRREHDAYRQSD